MWDIYLQWNITQQYKKNEILSLVTTQMELEGIMQSKISQTEKDKYSIVLLIYKNLEKQTKQNKKSYRSRNLYNVIKQHFPQ